MRTIAPCTSFVGERSGEHVTRQRIGLPRLFVASSTTRARVGGRRRVRDMVRDEAHAIRLQPGERGGEELGRTGGVERAERLPAVERHVAVRGRRERGVVGVRDRVEVGGREAGVPEAPPRGVLGQLPGRERHARLPVLAPGEALLLRGGDDRPVGHERRGRVV